MCLTVLQMARSPIQSPRLHDDSPDSYTHKRRTRKTVFSQAFAISSIWTTVGFWLSPFLTKRDPCLYIKTISFGNNTFSNNANAMWHISWRKIFFSISIEINVFFGKLLVISLLSPL